MTDSARLRLLAIAMTMGALTFPLNFAAAAKPAAAAPTAPAAPYADIADLADSAPIALIAEVRKVAPVDPARTSGVRAGWGRFYIEAKTRAFLSGSGMIGESLRYLADLPLDAKSKPPKLAKARVILFARDPRGRPGELQLVAPDAQVEWNPATEARLRGILSELHAPSAAPKVRGLREALFVPGTLAGEGETQFSLATGDDTAASITVIHRPGAPASWSLSFGETIDGGSGVPQRDTLAWYRLACFLPAGLPAAANLSAPGQDAVQAAADYRMVMRELGPCVRLRR